MSKKNKKTRKLTLEDLKPENFASQEEAQEALDEYYNQHPIYNYFQFFMGNTKLKDNSQEGKPTPPY